MIAATLMQAEQLKAASATPLVIQPRANGWGLVSRYTTLTAQQRAALLALADAVQTLRGTLRIHYAVAPIYFEQCGVATTGYGLALARQLEQLKLLRCFVGKFSLTVAAINMIEQINQR